MRFDSLAADQDRTVLPLEHRMKIDLQYPGPNPSAQPVRYTLR